MSPCPVPDVYDKIAPHYDERYTSAEDQHENRVIRDIVMEHFGEDSPRTLDVGCGTGLVLDIGITEPHLFTGVDPSRAMLQELHRKHPRVHHLEHATLETVTAGRLNPPYQLVTALFGVGTYLTTDTREALQTYAAEGGLVVIMTYADGWVPDYYLNGEREEQERRVQEVQEQMALWEGRPRTTQFRMGHFDVTVVRP